MLLTTIQNIEYSSEKSKDKVGGILCYALPQHTFPSWLFKIEIQKKYLKIVVVCGNCYLKQSYEYQFLKLIIIKLFNPTFSNIPVFIELLIWICLYI